MNKLLETVHFTISLSTCIEAHVRQILNVFMYDVKCRSEAGADGKVFVFAAAGQRPRSRSLPALRPIMGHSYSAQWIDGSAKLGHRHEPRSPRFAGPVACAPGRAASVLAPSIMQHRQATLGAH